MFRRIMVAYDSSVYSYRALITGLEMAKTHKSQINIVAVLGIPCDETKFDHNREHNKYFYTSELEKAVAIAEKEGIQATAKILYGPAGESLINFANQNQIELIIAGSHGKRAVKKLSLGSVSNFLTRHAKCNILIVRECLLQHYQ